MIFHQFGQRNETDDLIFCFAARSTARTEDRGVRCRGVRMAGQRTKDKGKDTVEYVTMTTGQIHDGREHIKQEDN